MNKKSEKDNVKKVFFELKGIGLIDESRKIRKRKVKTFRASLFGTSTYYDPLCSALDKEIIRVALLHEEGHHRLSQNSRWLIRYSFLLLLLSPLSFKWPFLSFLLLLLLIPILFLFLFRPWKKKLMQDEYNADMWAAEKLFIYFNDKEPWETLYSALNTISSIVKHPKSKLRKKIRDIFDVHPSIEDRRDYVRNMFEKIGGRE